MAKFNAEIGSDIMVGLERMGRNTDKVMGEMVERGADAVMRNIRSNMRSSYKSVRSLETGLRKTRVYKTPSDDGIAVKVGFFGYNAKGVAVPLIVQAREKGTRRGEKAKPFWRRSFNKAQIQAEMKKVEPKLFEGVK